MYVCMMYKGATEGGGGVWPGTQISYRPNIPSGLSRRRLFVARASEAKDAGEGEKCAFTSLAL